MRRRLPRAHALTLAMPVLTAIAVLLVWACVAVAAPLPSEPGAPTGAPSVRIKDITRVFGVRGNQLMGYGLVVGLRGTGDSRSTPFTARSMANMLERFHISVDAAEIRAKNVAAVMVTAALPPFAVPGDVIDVTASSVGDAKSLLGGTLLLTELTAADGKVYAVAQGAMIAGADALPTVGRVPAGATVEGYVPMSMLTPDGDIVLSLLNPDYSTAARIASAISGRFGEGTSVALDGGTVKVVVPEMLKAAPTAFIAELGELEVTPDAPARVVVNSRTGVVVIGGNVRVSPAAVSYNGFNVHVSQSSAAGTTGIQSQQQQSSDEVSGSTVVLESGSTIQALVAALNAVGARPRDIMSIMEALRACGALQAELEVF